MSSRAHRAHLLPLALLALLVLPACSSAAPPPIRHVFVIVLENKDADKTFAADSPAPYLAHELPRAGLFVPGYYGIGHASLPNYIAMVSGQAPNPVTQTDCQIYHDVMPGTMGPDGQAVGQGCVYPAEVKTIADQLAGAGLTWKGYMEDMGADAKRDGGTTCAHPALNSRDTSQAAAANDQYAARHNPFVYFHSIIDDPSCAADDVPLSRLPGDLATAEGTANLSFIVPDLCHDAHDAKCVDGGPGGLPAADAFLKEWVPKITTSPAFKDGLLVVTFDEAEDDAGACCGEPTGPNTPSPGGSQNGPGAGGGKVGAVLLSPYITAATKSTKAYNHYSLLRSLEDLFALPHLGYAGMEGLEPFGEDVYSNPAGTTAVSLPASVPAPTGGGTDSTGSGNAGAAPCAPRSLAGTPRRLGSGTLLKGLAIARSGAQRVVSFTATKGALVYVRARGRTQPLHVKACRAYRVTVSAAAGSTVRVAAASGSHVERRALRVR